MITKKSICIVTRTDTAPGAVSLLKAGLAQGHLTKIVVLGSESLSQDIAQASLVFYRIGPRSYEAYEDLVAGLTGDDHDHLQNTLKAFDKIETHKMLSESEVPVPKSKIISKDSSDYFEFPFVLKIPRGNQGVGVELVQDEDQLIVVKNELLLTSPLLLAQEYIAESRGSDKRVIVAGGEVVAAMVRTANTGDFRANLHQGGSATAYTPTSEETGIAIAACDALGLNFAGVDIIDSSRGPLVLEVNPSPGLGISEVVGFNVAERVIRILAENQER